MTPTCSGAAAIVRDHVAASVATTQAFFDAHAGVLAEVCRRLADRFEDGGTLFVAGTGAQASDAQHVSVEFVHPIIVGKRALPAVALTCDAGALTAHPENPAAALARPLDVLGTARDICLAICGTSSNPLMRAVLESARRKGMLTILIGGCRQAPADLELYVDSTHPWLVQEVLETTYHVLWELVHVFFDRDERQLQSHLIPPGERAGEGELLAQVRDSTLDKAREICRLRHALGAGQGARVAAAGLALRERFRAGGRLLAFGNGGSATDAQDAATDCLVPPLPGWRSLPALALTNDVGVVTAIGNDVGFERVFARQVTAFGRPGDVAVGFSTSGSSRNVIAALQEARTRGLLTLAFCGGSDGALTREGLVDYSIVAPADHLPRIQEAHATAWHALLSVAHAEGLS